MLRYVFTCKLYTYFFSSLCLISFFLRIHCHKKVRIHSMLVLLMEYLYKPLQVKVVLFRDLMMCNTKIFISQHVMHPWVRYRKETENMFWKISILQNQLTDDSARRVTHIHLKYDCVFYFQTAAVIKLK